MTIGLVGLVGVLGFSISGTISDIVDNGQIGQRLEERFQSLRESIRPLEEAASRIDEVTNGGEGRSAETVRPRR